MGGELVTGTVAFGSPANFRIMAGEYPDRKEWLVPNYRRNCFHAIYLSRFLARNTVASSYKRLATVIA